MNPIDTYTLLTFSVSDVSAQACRDAVQKILNKQDVSWSFSEKVLCLTEIYEDMPPMGGAHLPKFVIWEPCLKGGTIFFCNLIDGWPLLTRALSRVFPQSFTHVRISNNYYVHPVSSLVYWVQGKEERCIQLLKDDKWEFFQKGHILPFENPEYYLRQSIKDRLSKEIIIEYLLRLGWDVKNPNLWKSDNPAFYGQKLRH